MYGARKSTPNPNVNADKIAQPIKDRFKQKNLILLFSIIDADFSTISFAPNVGSS